MAFRGSVPGILVLYQDPLTAAASTIDEHVHSFSRYSRFPVITVNTQLGFPADLKDLSFQVIILHYSLFGRYPFLVSHSFLKYLEASPDSFKIALFQDEHQNCQQRFAFINQLRIDAIYSLLEPTEYERVYLSHTACRNICHTLTGYVDETLVEIGKTYALDDCTREVDIGYRGRPLAYFMGAGAREKTLIGLEFNSRLAGSDLRLDIKTGEDDRIYGENWYRFVGNCRAMLGVESGVSVFDLTGEAKEACDVYLRRDPHASWDEISPVLHPWEDNVYYRTISPRMFETAALRTCMILFEGRYNDILQPMVHYIPLRKDFSNFDWVMERFRDPAERKRITDRAYADLIASGRYGYRRFIEEFDQQLEGFGLTLPPVSDATRRTMHFIERDQAKRRARARSRLRVRSALRTVLRRIPGTGAISSGLAPARRWYGGLKWAKFQ